MLTDVFVHRVSDGNNIEPSRSENEGSEDPEDILNSCLGVLYDYVPITHADAGRQLIYTYPGDLDEGSSSSESPMRRKPPIKLILTAPHTQARNWSLHASSIWTSAVFLANHIDELELERFVSSPTGFCSPKTPLQILELGAGAGLPGLVVAKWLERFEADLPTPWRRWQVVLSDYPDEMLIAGLRNNVASNGFRTEDVELVERWESSRVHVCPYAWGEDTSDILPPHTFRKEGGYDLIIAADTLWNAAQHAIFTQTLSRLLKPASDSRIHLVAGFHTGRYAISGFLRSLHSSRRELSEGSHTRLEVVKMEEREVEGMGRRPWGDSRDEDEAERRRWVVWIQLGWSSFS